MMSNKTDKPQNGEFVFSNAGHDKGKCYVVLSVAEDRAYIADGKCRKTFKPKAKNPKHLRFTSKTDKDLQALINAGEMLTDKKIRKAIQKFKLEPMDE